MAWVCEQAEDRREQHRKANQDQGGAGARLVEGAGKGAVQPPGLAEQVRAQQILLPGLEDDPGKRGGQHPPQRAAACQQRQMILPQGQREERQAQGHQGQQQAAGAQGRADDEPGPPQAAGDGKGLAQPGPVRGEPAAQQEEHVDDAEQDFGNSTGVQQRQGHQQHQQAAGPCCAGKIMAHHVNIWLILSSAV